MLSSENLVLRSSHPSSPSSEIAPVAPLSVHRLSVSMNPAECGGTDAIAAGLQEESEDEEEEDDDDGGVGGGVGGGGGGVGVVGGGGRRGGGSGGRDSDDGGNDDDPGEADAKKVCSEAAMIAAEAQQTPTTATHTQPSVASRTPESSSRVSGSGLARPGAASSPPSPAPLRRLRRFLAANAEVSWDLFSTISASGLVDSAQFRAAVGALGGEVRDLDLIFARLDARHKGKISFSNLLPPRASHGVHRVPHLADASSSPDVSLSSGSSAPRSGGDRRERRTMHRTFSRALDMVLWCACGACIFACY